MDVTARAERKAALLRGAEELAEQLRKGDAAQKKLLAQRKATCHSLREAGASMDEIQEVFGVGRSRVQQILRG